MPSIYLAGPLFTQAEYLWNEELAQAIHNGDDAYNVILPQRHCQSMLDGMELFNPKKLFRMNCESILKSDWMVAILDGPDCDSGTSWEVGFAYAKKKPVIALRTDFRRGGDDQANVNLMLGQCVSHFIQIPNVMRKSVDYLANKLLLFLNENSPSGCVPDGLPKEPRTFVG